MNILIDVFPAAILFFFFSFVSIYLINGSGFTKFFVDRPDKRKIHSIIIPRIGGFCILIGFFITFIILFIAKSSLVLFWFGDSVGQSIIFSAIVIFIMGFLDDTTFFEISNYQKLIIQFVVAIMIVFVFNLYVSEFNFLGRVYHLGIFGRLLTVLWIVGVINAFNIIDGIDGLMGCLALVTLIFATVLFLNTGDENCQQYMRITIPIIVMVLAFLKYNYSPAVIFAGDSGSMFLGAVAAVLSVKLGTFAKEGIETISVFYIVAFPVIEVLVSMVRRYAYGFAENKSMREKIKMMMIPDNRHMHHRLINKGYSHERVLLFITLFSVLLALCSILLSFSQNSVMKVVIILYSFFVIIRVIDYLDYGKTFLQFKSNKIRIEKYLFIFTDDKCFEESIISAVGSEYVVEKFETILNEHRKKHVESFIIYNENDDFIERDINKIYEIRELFNTAVFFISTKENLNKYNYILEKEKNVYFAEKPCDIAMLIHNIEKISYSGSINENIYVFKEQEEIKDASKN